MSRGPSTERAGPSPAVHPAAAVNSSAAGRFAAWSIAGLAGLVALGALLGLLISGTTAGSGSPFAFGWLGSDDGNSSRSGFIGPLLSAVQAGLLFVGEIGAQVAGLVLPVTVGWLVLRRAWAPALYAAVTGLGAVVLAMAIGPLVLRLEDWVRRSWTKKYLDNVCRLTADLQMSRPTLRQ